MRPGIGHGPRLTEKEYEQRIVAVHEERGSGDAPLCEDQIRRIEFDLTIDYRLGLDFPRVRREELWLAQNGIEKRRRRLTLWRSVRHLLFQDKDQDSDKLAQFMIDAYRQVLSRDEAHAFFGHDHDDSR